MHLLSLLDATPPLGALPHQITWRLDAPPRVARLVPLGPDGPPARPPHGWDTLRLISASQAAHLGLHAPRGALLAARPWHSGTPLAELALPAHDWQALARSLALALALLHDAGHVHGDLQPGNVLIDAQRAAHLIDLPLLPTAPDQRGHVAGSAPTMAPELWRGGAPSQAADRYALAHLVAQLAAGAPLLHADSLTGWAIAHERGVPALPAAIPAHIAGVLRRMLDPDPDARPPLSALLDQLAPGPAPRVTFNLPLHRDALDEVIAALPALNAPLPLLTITAPPGGGRTRALDQLARAIPLTRRAAVLARHDDPEHPWTALLDALTIAAQELLPNAPPPPAPWRGDRLHGFDGLLRWLLQLPATDQPPALLWDDLHLATPDVLAWLAYAQQAATGAPRVILIASHPEGLAPSALRVDRAIALPQPDAAQWQRWRAHTIHAAPRDLAQGRWRAMLDTCGGSIGQLLAQLDAEHAQERTSQTAETLTRPAYQAAQSLLQQGAPVAAAQRCAAAWGQVRADERAALLELWTRAALQSGDAATQRALDEALGGSEALDVRLIRVQLAHHQGRHADGLALLEPLDHTDASVARWRAQLMLSAGQLQPAGEVARAALERLGAGEQLDTAGPRVEEEAHLRVLALAADAMGGDQGALDVLARLAPALEHPAIPATLRARCHAYRGIGLTRRDAHEAAADAYLRALEQIEGAGLDAELPLYLLNVGTAYHKQGRLGLAREYYARGARVAQPTTRATTRALLFANQANIDAVLGRGVEAAAALETALQITQTHGLGTIALMCRTIEGDLAAQAGQHALALERYQRCLEELGESASAQRRAELWLHIAATRLATQAMSSAREALDTARALIERDQLTILQDYHGILRARLLWGTDAGAGVMAGSELYRRHLMAALQASNHVLVLQHGPLLWRRLVEEGMESAAEIAALIEQARRAIAAGLTRQLREEFFARLPAMEAPAPPTRPARAPASQAGMSDVEPFYRMLSFNELILHTPGLDALWPRALEIALQLSGAERGFLLMWAPGERQTPHIAASSGEEAGGAAVSLTIAQEAAQTGRTVVTLNAREDMRFQASHSVVDLDLMSVLCVPVRDASGLLGALYLDHRARRGMFAGEVVRMMEAYGHQLALAINNARRLEELERERAALVEARDARDALLAERELSLDRMAHQLEQAREELERRGAGESPAPLAGLIYAGEPMARIVAQVRRIGPSEIAAVIIGESGTGKELVARAIHMASGRAGGPFVPVNCAAIPETLFESELFGHVKGAFTGAASDKKGLFQAARGGTLFLDELGEMPVSMQVKLLRVLQERRVRRVGAVVDEAVDVRIVAATNKELGELVEAGEFREDLYYRLAAFVLRLPPLRERRGDIALLATSLLARLGEESGARAQLTPQGAEVLLRWEWPGNVRELENVLRTACVLSEDGRIGPREILPLLQARRGQRVTSAASVEPSAPLHKVRSRARGRRPKATREEVERALAASGGALEEAAEQLGVTVRTLYRYIERLEGQE